MRSLMTGRTDATILSPPHLTMAVKSGYRVLADMGTLDCGGDCDEAYSPGTMVTLTASVIGMISWMATRPRYPVFAQRRQPFVHLIDLTLQQRDLSLRDPRLPRMHIDDSRAPEKWSAR